VLVSRFFFAATMASSGLYLLAFTVVVYSALGQTQSTATLTGAAIWMGPIQAIISGMLGVFFTSGERRPLDGPNAT
jgi:hypothetical protein